MSEADDTFDTMHADLFEAVGEDATAQRGADPAVPVRVIVDRGVVRLGEYGEAVGRVDVVSFMRDQWIPKQGDVITIGASARKVDTLEADDGFVSKASLHG